MTDHLTAIARKVRTRRESLGLSVRQAAAAGGLTRATWADVEAGKRTHVRARTLDAIDAVLRFTPGTLAAMAGTMVHDAPAGDRRITVLLEAKSGEPADLVAREQLVHYAATATNYDVQRVLTYIDRMPPPPDIEGYVREAVERALAELLAKGTTEAATSKAIASAVPQAKRRAS